MNRKACAALTEQIIGVTHLNSVAIAPRQHDSRDVEMGVESVGS